MGIYCCCRTALRLSLAAYDTALYNELRMIMGYAFEPVKCYEFASHVAVQTVETKNVYEGSKVQALARRVLPVLY